MAEAEWPEYRRGQRRNPFSFVVTWPEGAKRPTGCPRSYRTWYPTADAAALAQRGYEEEGAEISD